MLRMTAVGAVTAGLLAVPACTSDAPAVEQGKPNVVVIMVDDMRTDDLAAMPKTRRLLGADGAGATYTNAYATLPLCCPARATFLSGQYPHNHGVWDNEMPHGGLAAFDESDTLPVWMQAAGYQTVMAGKYLNGYGSADGVPATHVPVGWDSWAALVGGLPRVHNYNDFDVNRNGAIQRIRGGYQTWNFTGRAVSQLNQRLPSADPTFLWLSYMAPHEDYTDDGQFVEVAPKYQGRSTVGAPKSAAFNERVVGDKPSWVKSLPKLSEAQVADMVQWRRERRDSLRSVDDGVARVVRTLREHGELDNTVLMFVSDNGYLLGEHRLPGRKRFPYEESIAIPLLVRGPGLPTGVRREPVVNVDLAATIADIAGVGLTTHPLDGWSLQTPPPMDRPVLLESPKDFDPVPAYAGVRVGSWTYLEYASTRELYNATGDPGQTRNRIGDPSLRSKKIGLSGILDRLRDCVGAECR